MHIPLSWISATRLTSRKANSLNCMQAGWGSSCFVAGLSCLGYCQPLCIQPYILSSFVAVGPCKDERRKYWRLLWARKAAKDGELRWTRKIQSAVCGWEAFLDRLGHFTLAKLLFLLAFIFAFISFCLQKWASRPTRSGSVQGVSSLPSSSGKPTKRRTWMSFVRGKKDNEGEEERKKGEQRNWEEAEEEKVEWEKNKKQRAVP